MLAGKSVYRIVQEGTFEDYMTRMMTAPIVGAVAGNVLRLFRVELDYAHEMLYLSGPGQ